MVNYSIVMRNNPMDADAAKKAYASAQYAEVMDINRFAEHIASHGCVKIQLGDLGDFSISINSIGAESSAAYNPAIHARKLNVNWSAGTRFRNLLEDAVFNLVATRKAARLVVKALKAGKTNVDLTGEAKEPENGGQQA